MNKKSFYDHLQIGALGCSLEMRSNVAIYDRRKEDPDPLRSGFGTAPASNIPFSLGAKAKHSINVFIFLSIKQNKCVRSQAGQVNA